MMIRNLSLHLLAMLALMPLSICQTTRPTSKPSSRPTAGSTTNVVQTGPGPHKTMAAAIKLFERAKVHQTMNLKPGQITSFHGKFAFSVRIPATKDKPLQVVEGDYDQKWAFRTLGGKREFAYRRTIDADLSDWKSTLVSDFDDDVFGYDANSNRAITVRGRENATNRKRVADEKRAARRLFPLLFLIEMKPQESTFKIVAKDVVCEIKIGNVSSRVPMGSKKATIIAFRDQTNKRIKLWIDTEAGKNPVVLKAEILDPAAVFVEKDAKGNQIPAPEIFELAQMGKTSLPTGEILYFPARMRYSIGKREVMTITIDDMKMIRFNCIKNLTETFEFPE